MDRMLYVAMTGAKETLNAQAVNNHNLANASTTGFRAESVRVPEPRGRWFRLRLARLRHQRLGRLGQPVGRIAVHRPRSRRRDQRRRLDRRAGSGWQGSLYTRRRPAGRSRTASSRPAPAFRCSVTAGRSTCRRTPLSSSRATDRSRSWRRARRRTPSSTVDRIKLVKPADEALERGDDGLFRMKDGSDAPAGRHRADLARARSSRATSTPPMPWST